MSRLNISARAGRNSPGALWCPSSPPSPETVKPPKWNTEFVPWPGTGVSIWGWTGSATVQGAMASRLCVLPRPVLQLRICVHLHIYFGAIATPILPLLTGLSKTCLGWHVGCILLVLWRKKGHPRYNRSSQSNKVITIHLDMAQLSTGNHYNFIKLTYYRYLAYLLQIWLMSLSPLKVVNSDHWAFEFLLSLHLSLTTFVWHLLP